MAKKEIKIPFLDGNLLRYEYPHHHDKIEYKDNYEFKDKLAYTGYGRGRSAAYFRFTSLRNKKTYYMFMTDMDDCIPLMMHGMIEGTFTFTKRGKNFGIKLVPEPEIPY